MMPFCLIIITERPVLKITPTPQPLPTHQHSLKAHKHKREEGKKKRRKKERKKTNPTPLPHSMASAEFVDEYRLCLVEDLCVNSKPVIDNLTTLAAENKASAHLLVEVICERVVNVRRFVPSNKKTSVLFQSAPSWVLELVVGFYIYLWVNLCKGRDRGMWTSPAKAFLRWAC